MPRESLREMAEEYGYQHGRCRTHGPFWSDTGLRCPACADEEEGERIAAKAETPACAWCGDPLGAEPPKKDEQGSAYHPHCYADAEAEKAPEVRDIAYEQVSASTDAELADRLAALVERYGKRGYPMPLLDELHHIRSEQYCRANGIESKPWVLYTALELIPAPKQEEDSICLMP